MPTLAPCCRAAVRVSYGGGTVAIEDAIVLGLKPDLGPVEAAIRDAARVDGPTHFTRPSTKYSDIMKVSVRTIQDLDCFKDGTVREMLHWQAGQLEYSVAALAIWMQLPAAKYVCERLPIWKIPLHRWKVVIKPFADECRRLGQIFGAGETEVGYAFQMRKLVSLMGRTDADADWEKEVADRTTDTTPKRGYTQGRINSAGYRHIRRATLRDLVVSARRELTRRAGRMSEYVAERWWNTPRGTSSNSRDVKTKLVGLDNPMLDLQLRPIKPVVGEVMSIDELLRVALITPHCRARGSTKPEPGFKCRALLAVDDATAFIAGYASQSVEVVTKAQGMVLRQDPADVAEWVSFDIGHDVWRVSNDYSNFNILNSLHSMQLIDMEFALMWSQQHTPESRDKMLAHCWVAASYTNATFSCPLGEYWATCGLWSGHRNTARDNTMLHVCYLNAIKSVQGALFGVCAQTSKQRICGDDETLAYTNWSAAVCHTLVADALGYESQVSKGMLSRRHDEFLQLVRTPGNVPQYPVAHTILTFCSGNWYKDPVRELATTVKDISDHLWDMVLGGLPHSIARQLGGEVLDYLMQVKTRDGKLAKLEWWTYRGCGLPQGHPLWGGTVTLASPILSPILQVGDVPSRATDDSLQRESEMWNIIGQAARERVKQQRALAAYRNIAKNELTKQYDAAALLTWPLRYSYWDSTVDPYFSVVVPHNRWRAVPDRLVARSARAVAVSVKFPPEMLDTDEMWLAIACLRPRERSAMLQGLVDRQKPTVGWRWMLPPLLRAV